MDKQARTKLQSEIMVWSWLVSQSLLTVVLHAIFELRTLWTKRLCLCSAGIYRDASLDQQSKGRSRLWASLAGCISAQLSLVCLATALFTHLLFALKCVDRLSNQSLLQTHTNRSKTPNQQLANIWFWRWETGKKQTAGWEQDPQKPETEITIRIWGPVLACLQMIV